MAVLMAGEINKHVTWYRMGVGERAPRPYIHPPIVRLLRGKQLEARHLLRQAWPQQPTTLVEAIAVAGSVTMRHFEPTPR